MTKTTAGNNLKYTLKNVLKIAGYLGLVLSPVVALAGQDINHHPIYFYHEDQSFGRVRPDEPAKQPGSAGAGSEDVYARRLDPPDESPMHQYPGPRTASADDGSRGSDSRPKYRDYYEQAAKRQNTQNDNQYEVKLGVGFGFSSFTGNAGLLIALNPYVAWGPAFTYYSHEDGNDGETTVDGRVQVMLRLPNPTMVTPFVAAGPGIETWRRSHDDGNGLDVFDDGFSPTGVWLVGASMRLAKYVALVGDLKSTTYTDHGPRMFDGDHSKYEHRSKENFELGLAFVF